MRPRRGKRPEKYLTNRVYLNVKRSEFNEICIKAHRQIASMNNMIEKNMSFVLADVLSSLHHICREMYGRNVFYTSDHEIYFSTAHGTTIEEVNYRLRSTLAVYGLRMHAEVKYDFVTRKLEFYYRDIGAIPYTDDLVQVVDI
jgi:hypothetical protein